ncbi:hypothetical protein C8R45DRAFT_971358 [Mycena sanguinolenta]|nr:hypothetical protein C8R45DRAFT_971358 [Mycena sanguinolenta]
MPRLAPFIQRRKFHHVLYFLNVEPHSAVVIQNQSQLFEGSETCGLSWSVRREFYVSSCKLHRSRATKHLSRTPAHSINRFCFVRMIVYESLLAAPPAIPLIGFGLGVATAGRRREKSISYRKAGRSGTTGLVEHCLEQSACPKCLCAWLGVYGTRDTG